MLPQGNAVRDGAAPENQILPKLSECGSYSELRFLVDGASSLQSGRRDHRESHSL